MEIRRKGSMKLLLIGVYLILTVAGVTLMKLGGNSGAIAIKEGIFDFNISLISAAGFLCYIFSFLIFTKLVTMFDLSFIMPLSAGATQILTLVVSYFVFKEKLPIQAIIGASCVILGIIVMNWKR